MAAISGNQTTLLNTLTLPELTDLVRHEWLMMQEERPDDYVIATGETHSVKEFVEEIFRAAGIDNWQDYVKIDQRYYRPTEVDVLVGDATKAKAKLGWEPKIKFKELIKILLTAECERLGIKLPTDNK